MLVEIKSMIMGPSICLSTEQQPNDALWLDYNNVDKCLPDFCNRAAEVNTFVVVYRKIAQMS